MDRITVRVEPRLKKKLEAEARERGVSPSEVVRQALESHLGEPTPGETCYDIARSIGIVGVYKDAPHDLSTNPEHMEGFGRE